MASKIENEFGTIIIENEVIAKIAGLAAMECYGIVGMAAKNVRDGIVHLLKRESLTKGVTLSFNDNALTIDLHIIVEYGTNISAIGETVVETIKYEVENHVGISVEKINIFVEGIRIDA